MVSTGEKINVLIVGASGKLGTLIAQKAIEHPNLQVSILVRDPTKASALGDQVTKAGGRIIKGDFSDIAGLAGVTKGFHTVISTARTYEEKAQIEGHIALIDDAVREGVVRFVPNCFCSVYIPSFSQEELARCVFMAPNVKIDEHLNSTSLKRLSIYPGLFMETFFESQQGPTQGYSGESDHVMNLTTYNDTAAFTVAAVANKDFSGDVLVSGDNLTYIQIVEAYNKVRGTHVEAKRLGSLDDLKGLQKASMEAKDYMSAAFLGLLTLLYDVKGTQSRNDNSKFPEVKPTSFEEFVKQRSDLKL